jgi:hypothetical protein
MRLLHGGSEPRIHRDQPGAGPGAEISLGVIPWSRSRVAELGTAGELRTGHGDFRCKRDRTGHRRTPKRVAGSSAPGLGARSSSLASSGRSARKILMELSADCASSARWRAIKAVASATQAKTCACAAVFSSASNRPISVSPIRARSMRCPSRSCPWPNEQEPGHGPIPPAMSDSENRGKPCCGAAPSRRDRKAGQQHP